MELHCIILTVLFAIVCLSDGHTRLAADLFLALRAGHRRREE